MGDPFANKKAFDNAKNNGGGAWCAPGYYPEITVTGFKAIECSSANCNAIVVEFDINKSNVPECPPGSGYSFVMMDRHQSFYSNVRRVIADLTGQDFDAISIEMAKGCTTDYQPLVGTTASLRVVQKQTRPKPGQDKPGVYSAHTFRMITMGDRMKQLLEGAGAAAPATT